MSVIIVDNKSNYTPAVLKLLHEYHPACIDYSDLDYKNLAKDDVVILTGGHKDPILWHKKQYAKETQLIKKHKGPIYWHMPWVRANSPCVWVASSFAKSTQKRGSRFKPERFHPAANSSIRSSL